MVLEFLGLPYLQIGETWCLGVLRTTHLPPRQVVLDSPTPICLLLTFCNVISAAATGWTIFKDDNPRKQNQFIRNSTRRSNVVADLPVTIVPSSGSVKDAILHDHIFPRGPCPGRVDLPLGIASAFIVSSLLPWVTISPSSVFKRFARILPPVAGAHAVPPLFLVARPGVSRRSGDLRGTRPLCGSEFPSISVYLPRL